MPQLYLQSKGIDTTRDFSPEFAYERAGVTLSLNDIAFFLRYFRNPVLLLNVLILNVLTLYVFRASPVPIALAVVIWDGVILYFYCTDHVLLLDF